MSSLELGSASRSPARTIQRRGSFPYARRSRELALPAVRLERLQSYASLVEVDGVVMRYSGSFRANAGERWLILGVLFLARTAMAFQFQSVAAISPVVMNQFGVDLADIGLLISLYLAPGIVVALPGGDIGRRYGDKPVVLLGFALMICGGLMMILASIWPWQLAGRLLAGVGGVLLNVLMSKMVADWFAGKEIATAMAIFVNSWPVGIAFALISLPPLVSIGGATSVHFATSALAGLGLLLIATRYKAPPGRTGLAVGATWPAGLVLRAVVVAGCIWGLYNAALGMVFGFGTAMLTERGWNLTAAGSTISLVLWLVSLSVPTGGIMADRTGRHIAVMLGGFALFAATLVIATRTEFVILSFAALGLVSGISAGPIMSLPAKVLGQDVRAAGMGVYFSVFYAMVVAGPIAAGKIASMAGTSRITFDIGAVMLIGCFVAYWTFKKLSQRQVETRLANPS
jgi:MFS family permease